MHDRRLDSTRLLFTFHSWLTKLHSKMNIRLPKEVFLDLGLGLAGNWTEEQIALRTIKVDDSIHSIHSDYSWDLSNGIYKKRNSIIQTFSDFFRLFQTLLDIEKSFSLFQTMQFYVSSFRAIVFMKVRRSFLHVNELYLQISLDKLNGISLWTVNFYKR